MSPEDCLEKPKRKKKPKNPPSEYSRRPCAICGVAIEQHKKCFACDCLVGDGHSSRIAGAMLGKALCGACLAWFNRPGFKPKHELELINGTQPRKTKGPKTHITRILRGA